CQPHWLAENNRALLRVVGQHQRYLRRIAAGLDDLKGRMHERKRRPHLVQRRRARERPVQLHAELGLEAWPDQLAGREDMASPPGLQNATEAGLVKSE